MYNLNLTTEHQNELFNTHEKYTSRINNVDDPSYWSWKESQRRMAITGQEEKDAKIAKEKKQ